MDKNSYIAFYNRALCYTKINELQMQVICGIYLKHIFLLFLLQFLKNNFCGNTYKTWEAKEPF